MVSKNQVMEILGSWEKVPPRSQRLQKLKMDLHSLGVAWDQLPTTIGNSDNGSVEIIRPVNIQYVNNLSGIIYVLYEVRLPYSKAMESHVFRGKRYARADTNLIMVLIEDKGNFSLVLRKVTREGMGHKTGFIRGFGDNNPEELDKLIRRNAPGLVRHSKLTQSELACELFVEDDSSSSQTVRIILQIRKAKNEHEVTRDSMNEVIADERKLHSKGEDSVRIGADQSLVCNEILSIQEIDAIFSSYRMGRKAFSKGWLRNNHDAAAWFNIRERIAEITGIPVKPWEELEKVLVLLEERLM